MAIYKFLAADRTAMAATLRTQWDNQVGPCTLEFYDGAMPAAIADAVTTQVLLGTLIASDPLGTEANGVLTFSAVSQDNAADNSGTAAWARLKDGSGAPRALFDVTNTAGTGAIKINTVNIVAGGPILLNTLTITMGGA